MTALIVGTAGGMHRVEAAAIDVTLEGHDVRSLDRDGTGWVAITSEEAWRSDDGSVWTEAAKLGTVTGTCVSVGPWGRFVGLAEARLGRLDDGTVSSVRSFDLVPGRSEWHTPWGGPPDVRSIAQDRGNVYVNVHVGGVPVSRDGGMTWSPTIEIGADVHQVSAGPEPGVVLAPCARGLAVSVDGGRSWTMRTDGLHATYARAVAVSEDRVLVSASNGPRGGHAAVYRQPFDGSMPFERCAGGLPEWFESNVNTFCLVASGPVVAIGTEEGDVYLSDDRGATWERVGRGLPRINCVAFG